MNKKMEFDLYQWMLTNEFIGKVNHLSNKTPSDEFFRSSDKRYQDLKEAYITGAFAKVLGCAECRLIDDVFPDAEIRIEKKTKKIEITELQDKNRKRGEEIRIDEKLRHQDLDFLTDVINNWPKWLVRSVQKKASKLYEKSNVDLVVYMNVSLYDWPSEKTAYWQKMHSVPNLIQDLNMPIPFKNIWVLHQNRVLKIWPEFQKFENESIAA